MSTSILNMIGPESKITLNSLAIDVKDLVDQVDFNNSISQENVVSTEYVNGKYNTIIKIPNNVLIYKDDLKNIPMLLEVIDQGSIKGNSIELSSFSIDVQKKIILIFMIYYGYVIRVNNEEYFTSHILDLFATDWWENIFNRARLNTINYIDLEISNGNQPVKNKELIYNSGLISVKEFRNIQPTPGMDILWALGIYFFEKILRNWIDQETPEINYTDTIMDVDLSPGKYVKLMDAKKFFLNQLRIFIGLRPSKIWFGGLYQSKFYEMIQQKDLSISKDIILEELSNFTNLMNTIYSGGNNILNGPADSGTEPFAIKNIIYSEHSDGINTTVTASIILEINLYNNLNVYTLPVTTKIN